LSKAEFTFICQGGCFDFPVNSRINYKKNSFWEQDKKIDTSEFDFLFGIVFDKLELMGEI